VKSDLSNKNLSQSPNSLSPKSLSPKSLSPKFIPKPSNHDKNDLSIKDNSSKNLPKPDPKQEIKKTLTRNASYTVNDPKNANSVFSRLTTPRGVKNVVENINTTPTSQGKGDDPQLTFGLTKRLSRKNSSDRISDNFSFTARLNSRSDSVDYTNTNQPNNKLLRNSSKFSFNTPIPKNTAHDAIIEEIETKTKARGIKCTQDNMVIIPESMCVDLYNFMDKKKKGYLTKDDIVS